MEEAQEDGLTEEHDAEESTHLIKNDSNEEQDHKQALKYPLSIYFILGFQFLERFSHYITQTILAVYMSIVLGYSDDTSTAIYHAYFIVIYLFPVIGSILAENWLGNFQTVFYFSVVYLIGNVIITLGSAADLLHIDIRWPTFIGLLLNALGTGIIKPCVSTLGGEQFTLPQHQPHLDRFFSHFIFIINAASLVAMFIAPMMRHDVKCFHQDGCYPLAYGVAAAVMALALITILVGYKWYIIRKPEGNILLKIVKCIGHALWMKKSGRREHWLDHADDQYDASLIHDVKVTLRVLVLFVPLPVFWALYGQLGSRWTLQATHMNRSIGFYTLEPEQVQVINSVLMLVFIPLFDYCVYPLLDKCHVMRRPLQRLGVGMTIGALAFVASALLELKLEPTYAVMPGVNEGQLRLYNGVNCTMNVQVDDNNASELIEAGDFLPMLHLPMTVQERNVSLLVTPAAPCNASTWSGHVTLARQEATSYLVTSRNQNVVTVVPAPPYDDVRKADSGNPKIRLIYDVSGNASRQLFLVNRHDSGNRLEFHLSQEIHGTNYSEIAVGSYDVTYDNATILAVSLQDGGVYSMLITEDHTNKSLTARLLAVTPTNSVPLYWQLPQHVLLTISEVMVSITGLSFSFSQAPVLMKSVLTAAWLIAVSNGNLIVVIDAERKIFTSQAYEYLLFAGFMLVNVVVFAVLALRYKYVEPETEGPSSETHTSTQEQCLVDS